MSEDKLRHWSALSKTDPKHTKGFQRAGGFKGTATRPIWNEMRLTEHFGPCGFGWGMDKPEFTLVPAGNEILVYCTLRCWYRDGDGTCDIWGVGGDKAVAARRDGPMADDEAFKKAFTDALGNAFKHVGVNADIHMGLFEDSKYRDEVSREFADEPRKEVVPNQAATTTAAQHNATPRSSEAGASALGPRPGITPEQALYKRIASAIVDAAEVSEVEQTVDIYAGDIERLPEAGRKGIQELVRKRHNELRAT